MISIYRIKKAISAVLTAALLLSSPIAFAANDNQQGTEYSGVDLSKQDKVNYTYAPSGDVLSFADVTDETQIRDIGLLGAFGIIGETADGNFRPDDSITRYEFVEYVLKLMNVDAESIHSPSIDGFYDTSDEHYNKVASVAASLGIISGYGDNSYRGDETISHLDALTVVVRALGWGQYAAIKGGYPAGYITAAKKAKIYFSGADSTKNLKRGEAAHLLAEAIDGYVLDTASYGDYNEDFEYSETASEKYHDTIKATGVVESAESSEKNEIVIDGTKYTTDSKEFRNFLRYKVDFYYTTGADDSDRIVFMEANSDVSAIRIPIDDINDIDASSVTYFDSEKGKKTKKIDSSARVYINGIESAPRSLKNAIADTDGFVTILSNDGGSRYTSVFIEKYSNMFLSGISSDGAKIYVTPGYMMKKFNLELGGAVDISIYGPNGARVQYDVTVDGVYDANGKPVTTVDFSAVPSNTIISIFADSYEKQRGYLVPADDCKRIKIMVCDSKIKGQIEAVGSDGKIKIDGKKYDVAKSNYFDEPESKLEPGMTGTLYFDSFGKAVCFKEEATKFSFKYGYLINAKNQSTMGTQMRFKILTEENKIEEFYGSDNCRLNGEKPEGDSFMANLKKSAQMANADFEISQLIKYKLNSDGKIAEVQTILAPLGRADGADEDHIRLDELKDKYSVVDTYINGRPFKANFENNAGHNNSSSTDYLYYPYFAANLTFTVPDAETFTDSHYYVGMNMTTYYNEVLELYDIDKIKTPAVALHYVQASNMEDRLVVTMGDSRKMPVMVKEFSREPGENSGERYAITVASGQTEKTFYADSESVFAGFEPGDVVWLYTDNPDNTITKCEAVKYKEQFAIKPGNFPDINDASDWKKDIKQNTLNSFGEVYYMDGRKMIIQRGPIVNEATGERQIQITGFFSSNYSWMYGGAIVYDNTSSRDPIIKPAKMADVKTVYTDGASNASKVYFIAGLGAARQYVFFNMK